MAEANPLETGRKWIDQLGGSGAQPRSFFASRSLAIGHFRFPRLDEEVEAQPLPFHYVSVTLGGPLRIEARVGGERLDARVRNGQSILMAAGLSNSWRWDRPTEEGFIFLSPDYLSDVAVEAGGNAPDMSDRFVFEDASLRRTILAMVEELSAPGGPSDLFMDMAGQCLALRLLRRQSGRDMSATTSLLTAAQLRKVIEAVADRLGEAIGLDDLAGAAGVSRFHFVRSFKATTGLSPHQWLTVQRIGRAKDLLARTALGMMEIAAAVGFESQSHFGQVFRQHTGSTPRDWRNARRN